MVETQQQPSLSAEPVRRRAISAQESPVGYPRWIWPLMTIPAIAWVAFFLFIPLYTVISVAFGSLNLFLNPVPTYQPWRWDPLLFSQVLDGFFGTEPFYRPALFRTLTYVPIAVGLCLLIGYGVAYYVARHAGKWKGLYLALLVGPLFINYILRIYAWLGPLQQTGWVNELLVRLHLVRTPVNWLSGEPVTVVVGLVYGYIPYMILPLYAQLDRIPQSVLDAAHDLGAGPISTGLRVLIPLSKQGILSGVAIIAFPMLGDFFTNNILSTPKTAMFGNLIDNAVHTPGQAPAGAALALLLLLPMFLLLFAYVRSIRSAQIFSL